MRVDGARDAVRDFDVELGDNVLCKSDKNEEQKLWDDKVGTHQGRR